METTNCPICRCGAYRIFLKAQSENWREEFSICQCDDCGFCFVNPRPSIDEIGRYYPPSYHSDPARSGSGWIEIKRQLQYSVLQTSYGWPTKIAPRLARLLSIPVERGFGRAFPFHPGKRLLDIGAGNGEFLLWLRDLEASWQLTGVELSPAACEIARRNDLRILNGTLNDQSFPDESFDIVTMWNVLEHLHNPMDTLREIYHILSLGGYLALVVPNIASSQFKRFGADWWVLQLPQHLQYFSPDTLRLALTKAGFDVQRLQLRRTTYSHMALLRANQKPNGAAAYPGWRIKLEKYADLTRSGDVMKAIALKTY